MSRKPHIPSYRKHRQSGQAIVTLPDGFGSRRDFLLGRYGSKESRMEYARVIAEWEEAGRRLLPQASTGELSVNEMLLGYWKFAEGYYVKRGKPTNQQGRIRYALKPVKAMYGHTAAKDFGPKALKTVRDWMVKQEWSRKYINAAIGCIKRTFRWAVSEELLSVTVYQALQTVPGLKKGRTETRELPKVLPVSDWDVEATLPYLNNTVAAMVKVQRLTGMRPCEVVAMRLCDIDRGSADMWTYIPESHKTEHYGHKRTIFLGPQAQQVLTPFLDGRQPGQSVFSPREAMQSYRERQRNGRKSKVQPSQESRRKRQPKHTPGESYCVSAYHHAIRKGCFKAGTWVRIFLAGDGTVKQLEGFSRSMPLPWQKRRELERDATIEQGWLALIGAHCVTIVDPNGNHERQLTMGPDAIVSFDGIACQLEGLRLPVPLWAPNRLRHAMATEIRREAGLDAARVVLGHRSPQITETYAEMDLAKAAEVMKKLG